MKRYKELKYEDKTYTEQYKINDILINNGFDWFLDCEVENVRLEIFKNTLIFNSGVFFNGNWEYGVFRDGQWKYGTWSGGVWYNGTWYNGIFENGLIFNGRFINGKIIGGEIRGGEFFDIIISDDVIKNIEVENKNSPKPQQGKPQNRGLMQKEQEFNTQPEKIQEKIKRFNSFNETIKWYNRGKFHIQDIEPVIYDDFITNDYFRQFLLDNDCYNNYIENCERDFKENFSKNSIGSYIGSAFEWAETEEGESFWEEIDTKWLIYLIKNKKTNESVKQPLFILDRKKKGYRYMN